MAVEKASISVAVEIFGFIVNTVRDYASNKLKEGDLINEKLRKVLVRDLKEINTKLDYLFLKDLDASRSFLKEGISILILALDKPSEDQETSDGPDGATAISNDIASGNVNAVLTLTQSIKKLPVIPEKKLEEAKKCFHDARKDATHAFNYKSPSIIDRVMACKIRIAARILESGLDDAETAVTACLSAVEELHGLKEIKSEFSALLNEGMKARFKKAKRLEIIMSVLSINHTLFDFAAKCSRNYPSAFTWPRIKLADRVFHPILHAYEIVEKTPSGEEFCQQLSRMVAHREISGHEWYFAVNSRGEIILLDHDKITVIYSSAESKDVMFSATSENNVVKRWREAVAVDSDDNVYLMVTHKTLDENRFKENSVLCVLDENYNIKHDSIVLKFCDVRELREGQMAVDKNQNIIMMKSRDNQVYVCDNTGKSRSNFERDGCNRSSIGITDKNDIMVGSKDDRGVYVYTTEGDFKYTIEIPEDHDVWQMAFHHGICKIIVLTYNSKKDSCFLLCYSVNGKREHMQDIPQSGIKSHPSGTFAVLQGKIITYI